LSTPARNKPRLDEHVPTATDEAARKTASPESSAGLPPPAADNDYANANADPKTVRQSNAVTAGTTRRWTPEEDAELTSAVAKTKKKSWGVYKNDWVAAAALVPGRTNDQCRNRWRNALDLSIDWANGRTGAWTEDEDLKLKNSVQMHGGKDWAGIAVMVPGRTPRKCRDRWKDVLDPSIDRANGRNRKWTEDEDLELQGAVQMHGGKDWAGIAVMVPDRTKDQCHNRWKDVLDPSIDRANGRTGRWTEDEDLELKYSVQMHGGENWTGIAVMVPGRTKKQCRNRWRNV
jgi:myb proto-oncogene protein